jgi:hypothetical protein
MAEFVFVNAECETINVKKECVTVDVKKECVEEDPLMEVANSKTGDYNLPNLLAGANVFKCLFKAVK